MLQALSIRNFAIIDDLQVAFADGLNILTGETGAGKSIIINAVNLLLGSRATAKLIRTGADSAELEALFRVPADSPLIGLLKETGYDAGEELLIRRIISQQDRHRIYLNGRLATAQLLGTVTENLASISGQHAHQGLLQEEQQLALLDQFAGLADLREAVYRIYHQIVPALRRLEKLRRQAAAREERETMLAFQSGEIRKAAVTVGEDRLLEQERSRLKNTAALHQTLARAVTALYSEDGAVIERLAVLAKDIERMGQIDPALQSFARQLNEAAYRLEDIVGDLRTYLDGLDSDPQRLEAVEERINDLQKLKRKYGDTLEAVLARADGIEQELHAAENLSTEIASLESALAQQHDLLVEHATRLASRRRRAAGELAGWVIAELATLKMPQTRFQIHFESIPASRDASAYLQHNGTAIHETGMDQAVFLIAPNVGEALRPLAQIASGGELSRIVLALKAIIAKTESVETIVFDEVDAGIGGGTADGVGRKLAELANYHQVLCITHLPQIARYGTHHYRINKTVQDGRTRTTITPLHPNDRVLEIARMLGGENITEKTLAHAKELLSTAAPASNRNGSS